MIHTCRKYMIYINLNLKTCFRCKQEIANINIEKQRNAYLI